MYFHDTKATWHEASSVCHMTGAELITRTSANETIPRGRLAWFGVRSCPTGKLYTAHGIPYKDTRLFTTPACIGVQKPRNGATLYQTVSCNLKLPFACQKGKKFLNMYPLQWWSTSKMLKSFNSIYLPPNTRLLAHENLISSLC